MGDLEIPEEGNAVACTQVPGEGSQGELEAAGGACWGREAGYELELERVSI